MNRVSTVGNYSAVLANIQAAQQRQMEAGNQVASQKKGSDLKDFAKGAEMLTAMRTVDARVTSYRDQNKLIADRLTTQDLALNQVSDAAGATRQAIADALASGRAETLMEDLGGQFRNAVEGMNARHGGKYVFAGGKIDTMPVSATSMSDLTNPLTPNISDFFQNDDFQAETRVDDATTVKTGLLADDLGTNLMAAFKSLQAFHEGASGPFTGELTSAQKTYLEGVLSTWDSVRSDLTNQTARNGMVQARVETVQSDLSYRSDSLASMMGDITDADMTEAASALQQAQFAVQAAAQVFLTLKQTSLLNILQ